MRRNIYPKRKNRNECIDRSLYHFTCSCPASLVRIKGKRYNLYSAYFHVKRYGTSGLSEAGASIWNGNLLLLKIPLIVFGLYELCSAAYIITVILRKDKRLNIIVMVLGYAAMLLHLTTGLVTIADNTTMTMLLSPRTYRSECG